MTAAETRPHPCRGRLLVVDDEATQRQMLEAILSRAGYAVETAEDGARAVELLESRRFDLLLADQRMPKMDGLSLLRHVRRCDPELPVVLMTAYGSVSSAVEAMKRGATDYLSKPFESEELFLVLEKAVRQRRLEDEVRTLRGALRERSQLSGIVGASSAMQGIFSLIERVAGTDVPVLIRGESGTGKELVAHAIHTLSRRHQGPFVSLNCAAIPEDLLESEFFGHERGAFRGASSPHAGRFEQAHHGTLFLDEVGAMRVDLQAKLLRVIEDGQVQRLGSTEASSVDVRILAATSDDLESAVREHTFRDDLFYRLNVVPIKLPPLRERAEDVPLLADHFLQLALTRFRRPRLTITPEAMDRMQAYYWPGNVRELQNLADRLAVLVQGGRITIAELPENIAHGPEAGPDVPEGFELPIQGVRLPELERHLILQALGRCGGILGPAARLLGISYKTLQYRLRKYGLEREDFRMPSEARPGPTGPTRPDAEPTP